MKLRLGITLTTLSATLIITGCARQPDAPAAASDVPSAAELAARIDALEEIVQSQAGQIAKQRDVLIT